PAAAGSDRGRSGRGPARTVRGRRSRAPCRARRRRAARPVPADRPRRNGGGWSADRRARGCPWRHCPRVRTSRPVQPAPVVAHNELMASTDFLPGAQRSAQLSFSDQPAWIVKDEVSGGWVLQIGGAEQSHVDLEDPTRIVHEYLRRMANVLDEAWPRRAPIRIAHLGGGALTLVRYVQATRPGSPQVVVEIERELPTLVTTALPLPR